MFQRYKSYSPYDMQESIIKEVKGDLQKSFLVIGEHLSAILMKLFILYSPSFVKYLVLIFWSFSPVQCIENKQLYFAKRLNEAMKVPTLLPFYLNVAVAVKMSAVVTQV